jgi:riboflavin synthase
MFTGLIQEVGLVTNISHLNDAAKIEFECKLILDDLAVGDSVSVNGACLTVTSLTGKNFTVDVMIKTLELTSLGKLLKNQSVNLELAMAVSDRFGGHLVQGHVDGIGVILDKTVKDEWTILTVKIPKNLSKYTVAQGSICLDGVSLTIGEISGEQVSVWLIPTTLDKTNLGSKQIGDILNIEVDLLAKYVEKILLAKDEHAQ